MPAQQSSGYESSDEEIAELQIDYGMDRVIVVDNVPVVDASKFAKLEAVLRKLYAQCGEIAENGFNMPVDKASGMSKGYVFLEFTTAKSAEQAVKLTDKHAFDKRHEFRVCSLQQFDKYCSQPDEFEEPKMKPFNELEDLSGWLLTERGLRGSEMFVVRHGEETECYSFNAREKAVQELARKNWTGPGAGHVFSQLGSYLATYHREGIQLWGGGAEGKWRLIHRYPHNLCKFLDFSPRETYLVTMSDKWELGPTGKPLTAAQEETCNIWHIPSGTLARQFKIDDPSQSNVWPQFTWSHDDKYFARMAPDKVMIYETPGMGLLNSASMKLPGVQQFCWSPGRNIIAVYLPEQGQTPAKVSLIDVVTRDEVRSKALYNVTNVRMHWQSNGDYLCVKVDRHGKSKKTTSVSFELFRVNTRDVAVESLEMKDPITAFAWEPKGHRFVVCHGEPPRVDVSLYTMQPQEAKGKGLLEVKLLKTLEKRTVNHVFWAPTGGFMVLAGLKNLNGVLHFFNANDMELMAETEHFMCTDVDWDPSGRWVATSTSAWRQPLENGFTVWTFYGKRVYNTSVDKFYQFLWRPRPLSLLSNTQEKEIKKNLSKYSERYDAEDAQYRAQQSDRAAVERQAVREAFRAAEAKRKAVYEEQRAAREKLRGGYKSDDEDEWEEVEEEVEEVLDVKETPVE